MQKDGQFHYGADPYLGNIEEWLKSEDGTEAVGSGALRKTKKKQVRDAPLEAYEKRKKARKLVSDGPSSNHATRSQSSARKRAAPHSGTRDAKKRKQSPTMFTVNPMFSKDPY